MLVKRLHTIGKSKGVILDKSILNLLNIKDNDRVEITVYGDKITIHKYIEDANTNKKVG